ncbi:MAG TPA: hypothetical protein VJQ83_12600 [Tepidiformaceae bacterium]|nr:hypothetical protein [Tepidiformaceae bacterium]
MVQPRRRGFETTTITLSCGKLITGATVSQWSAILMRAPTPV